MHAPSRQIVVLAWMVLLIAPHAWATERVAVLEFMGDPPDVVSQVVLRTLSDEARRAATDVLPTDRYSIMTREAQETLLRDNDIDPVKLCEAACEIDVARTMGARWLVTGRVTKIGAKIFLVLKLFDADKGEVLGIVRASKTKLEALVDASYEKTRHLLQEAFKIRARPDALGKHPPTGNEMALGVIGMPSPADEDVALETGNANVQFRSTPAGAKVYVDGALACRHTPCTVGLKRGRARVIMKKIDFLPEEKVVRIFDGLSVAMTLEGAFGLLKIATDPEDLEVTLDGNGIAKRELKLEPGTYALRGIARCHDPIERRITIKRGVVEDVSLVAPERTRRLRVNAQRSGGGPVKGEVFIDGEHVGGTPFAGDISACAETVRVDGPYGLDWQRQLTGEQDVALTAVFSGEDILRAERREEQRLQEERARQEQARLQQQEDAARAAQQQAEIEASEKTDAARAKLVFWSNVGVMVTLGAVGVPLALFGFSSVGALDEFFGLSLPIPSLQTGNSAIDVGVPTSAAIVGLVALVLFVVYPFSFDFDEDPPFASGLLDLCAAPAGAITPGVCLGLE